MSRHVNKSLNKGEGRGTGAGKLQIGAGVWEALRCRLEPKP